MSGLAAVLALAARVVTLDAAVIAEKAVYVRVAVGTDSRIAIAEGMVRVQGQHSTAEMLGLKLGYARPTTLLLLHPRSSGLGEIKFVGLKHTMRLRIEASTLGTAQDLELRIAESEDKSAPPPAAGAAQAPKSSSVAPAGKANEGTTARATTPRVDGYPSPPHPRPTPSPSASPQKPAQPRLDGAPTPPQPRSTSAAVSRRARARAAVAPRPAPSSRAPEDGADTVSAAAPTPAGVQTPPEPQPVAATTQPAPTAPAEPVAQEQPASSAASAMMAATCPTALASTTKRLMRRVGRPGQRGIVLEELRHEGAQITLRARIEGAADAQLVQLALGALGAKLTVDRAGRDLVLSGTVADTLPLHTATLVLGLADHWERARFRLPQGGTS